ncbi:DUF2867 domain-containing protein [Nocardioides sp. SYSU D00038]|uniref:DUF2867 domain-containing protein n=1 Tax=Nocardioides sp. SYSU D00038 TaxID=2812554 RepID=UPI00196832A5|nr:DUF2867 domain-containing protein [Nocardioides sp. SYSU D00038]
MRRRSSLTSSSRSSTLAIPVEEGWVRLAAAGAEPRWYVDAAPLRFRGLVDRLVGGGGRRWPVPEHPLLRAGDRAGFWHVVEADRRARRLVLVADVRSPGRVELTSTLRARSTGCTLTQTVRLAPQGLVGAAYLLADLPAREAVVELTHRRTRTELG